MQNITKPEDVGVFLDGVPRRTRLLTDLGYQHTTGFLAEFKWNGKKYVFVKHSALRDQNKPKEFQYSNAGYYPEDAFLEYRAKRKSAEVLKTLLFPMKNLEKAEPLDTVKIRKIKIEFPYEDFCVVQDISWPYNPNEEITDKAVTYIKVSGAYTANDSLVVVDEVAKAFYQRSLTWIMMSYFPVVKRDSAVLLISKIALQIDRIVKRIFPLFSNDAAFLSYIISQKIDWRYGGGLKDPTNEDFALYLKRITEFYESTFVHSINIENSKRQTKLYWLANALSVESLKIVPAYDKIQVLKLIAEGTILGELSNVVPSSINEENLAVKIVRSISSGQEEAFLLGLQSIKFVDKNTTDGITLLESLYDKINNVGLGAKNLNSFMSELYLIWLRSSFFPYEPDGSLRENLVNPSVYVAKPIILGYESSDILLIFNSTNYDFSFNRSKIDVTESVDEVTGDVATTRIDKIGSYGHYQTVTVKKNDSISANSQFIAVNIDGTPRVAMPIFYLKYIDDKKETANLLNGVELTTEFILLFTGIGGVSKLGYLKHLRNIHRLGRAALGLEPWTAELVLMRFQLAEGLTAAITLTGKVGEIFNDYVNKYKDMYCDSENPNYNADKCKFHTKLANIFLMLQLVGEILDPVFSKKLRKAAQELMAGQLPSDFPNELFLLLTEFAGNQEEIADVFKQHLIEVLGENSVVWQRINHAGEPGEFTITERDEFITDFERAGDDVLQALNANNGELIVYWRMIKSIEFRMHRRNIKYLRSLKLLKNTAGLHREIFIGVLEKLPNGISWNAKGAHHKDALKERNKGGVSYIVPKSKKYDKVNTKYYLGKMLYYNPEYPEKEDELKEIGWKRKNKNEGISSFFRDDWEAPRIYEEMALSNMNKTQDGVGSIFFSSKLTDSVDISFIVRNGEIESVFPNLIV